MNDQKLFRGVGLIYRYHKLNHSSCRSWRLKFSPICASTEIELSNWIKNKPVTKNQPKAIFGSHVFRCTSAAWPEPTKSKFGVPSFSLYLHSLTGNNQKQFWGPKIFVVSPQPGRKQPKAILGSQVFHTTSAALAGMSPKQF